MKTEDRHFNGSSEAVNYFRWSIHFFRNHDVTTVGYNLIPDDLLRAWVAPDPQQLLSDMADGKADTDSTLPFAVYSAAHAGYDVFEPGVITVHDRLGQPPLHVLIRDPVYRETSADSCTSLHHTGVLSKRIPNRWAISLSTGSASG